MNEDRIDAYINLRMQKLRDLLSMWSDPLVQTYQDSALPSDDRSSVFLAGPTSRNQILEYNWRSEAVRLLREFGYRGWIFCPEPRGEECPGDFTDVDTVYTWESDRLMNAAHVLFWIPRKADELLGLNTNLELGIILGKVMVFPEFRQKLYVGWPNGAERMGLLKHYVTIAKTTPYKTLVDLCKAVAPRFD